MIRIIIDILQLKLIWPKICEKILPFAPTVFIRVLLFVCLPHPLLSLLLFSSPSLFLPHSLPVAAPVCLSLSSALSFPFSLPFHEIALAFPQIRGHFAYVSLLTLSSISYSPLLSPLAYPRLFIASNYDWMRPRPPSHEIAKTATIIFITHLSSTTAFFPPFLSRIRPFQSRRKTREDAARCRSAQDIGFNFTSLALPFTSTCLSEGERGVKTTGVLEGGRGGREGRR